MAENGLYPGYVLLASHSAYGKHNNILPTSEWSPTAITGNLGSWQGWNSVPIDGEAMVTNLVNALAAAFLSTYVFDTATVYTIATPGGPAIPRKSIALAIPGTSTLTGPAKATMQTWIFRDASYNLSKLVFLDSPVPATFEPTTNFSGGTVAAIVAEWTGAGNAWSSRAGLRPELPQKITYTMNEKLRREYGMA